MNQVTDPTDARLRQLAGRLRNTQIALALVALGLAAALFAGTSRADGGAADPLIEELKVRKLVVVDAAGTPRVVIQEEPAETDRRAQAAGIVLFDRHGNERGGMVTFSDDSAVIALDAPAGQGAPMRDRLGLNVYPDGSASVALIDNRTAVPVRLVTDAEGGGGLEMLTYDMEKRTATVTRLTPDGKTSRELDLNSPSSKD
jgi:hypothetical protein